MRTCCHQASNRPYHLHSVVHTLLSDKRTRALLARRRGSSSHQLSLVETNAETGLRESEFRHEVNLRVYTEVECVLRYSTARNNSVLLSLKPPSDVLQSLHNKDLTHLPQDLPFVEQQLWS